MATDNEIITALADLEEIIGKITAKEKAVRDDDTLSDRGKHFAMAEYLEKCGLLEKRDQLIGMLNERGEQVERDRVELAIANLQDEQRQKFIDRAAVAIATGGIDLDVAASIAELVKDDDAALLKLRRAAEKAGGTIEMPERDKVPNYKGIAKTLASSYSPDTARTNAGVLIVQLNDYKSMLMRS